MTTPEQWDEFSLSECENLERLAVHLSDLVRRHHAPERAAFTLASVLGSLALFAQDHKAALVASVKPCGKEGCDCHIVTRVAIAALVVFAETIDRQRITLV